jgi:hypothetical protein
MGIIPLNQLYKLETLTLEQKWNNFINSQEKYKQLINNT